jgi:hypothetical protein
MVLTFSNATLLIGLSAAAVPLMLHLLSRAQYTSVDWGAMLFLEDVQSRHRYTGQFDQKLLLVVRMGVVGLLAAAMAEPVLQPWAQEANTLSAQIGAMNHWELACFAGAIACGGLAAALLVAAVRIRRRPGAILWRIAAILVAGAAIAGAVALGQRALAFDAQVTEMMADQPPPSVGLVDDSSARSSIGAAILLDCSSGMGFEENGHTRFGLAQGAAKQILAGLHRGDRVSLILMGQRQTENETEPSADLQSVADRIDAARIGRQPADVADALLTADDVFDREGIAARDIYVVGDRRAGSWRSVNDFFMTRRWPQALQRSATRIFAVPIGNYESDNVAVERIELAGAPAIVGQPAELDVVVHNYGATPRAAVPLTVLVNGHAAFGTTIGIPAGRVTHVSVPLKTGTFSVAGSQVVSAEIRSAGYRDDDRLEAVVEAIDPIRVLVLSPDPSDAAPGQFRNGADFLRLALAPLQSLHRGRGGDPCKVDVMGEDQWPQVDFQKYQVVILANIERFNTAQVRAIEQFVYGGGGLLIAPGSLARVDNYNEQLWRDGAGILPAELEDATSADGSEATSIVGYDLSTPVFHFLHDQPDLPLSATIGRFFPTINRPPDSRTLAWYTSGAPFLIESHAGKGKVMLMTTSLDADWSTLPLSSFYLPYLQSAVRYLATGTIPVRNLSVGEPLTFSFDDLIDDRATVDLPEGDSRPVSLAHFGSGSELRFADTWEPGIYRVHVHANTGERTVLFAVQLPADQSDLTQLTEAQWRELMAGLHMRRIDPSEHAVAATVAAVREGHQLWVWALVVALGLTVVELGLSRFWSRDAY